MLTRRARTAAATVAAVGACALLPASALAATGSITASTQAGGVVGCAAVNLPPQARAWTFSLPYGPRWVPFLDRMLQRLGIAAQLPPGGGVLTVSVDPGAACGGGVSAN